MSATTLAGAAPVKNFPTMLHPLSDLAPARMPAALAASATRRHYLPRPALTVSGYYPAPDSSYAEVLVIADFAASGDEFHHRLIAIGQSLGSHISLLQLPGNKESDVHDGASDILLEGLLQRMKLPPGRCAIAASQPAAAIASLGSLRPKSKLIVVGRACACAHQPAFDDLLDLAYESGCDLIAVDDTPDWE